MKKAYVTFLGSRDFLPGILVLHHSLRQMQNDTDLVILVNSEIGAEVISFLETNSLHLRIIEPIENPYREELTDIRSFHMYTKLRIFTLTEYDKLVYLDADLLICDCIECLFDKPHMSGVAAGSIREENKHWTKLNAGVLVIEPSMDLFHRMESAIGLLPSSTKGDQGFLHSYYPDWEYQPALHLEHRFNIPAVYLDKYCETGLFSFNYRDKKVCSENVSIIHFWGRDKPWHYGERHNDSARLTKYDQAINLWWDYFDLIIEEH
jgi:alpha-N-acetylglucosamine transferase